MKLENTVDNQKKFNGLYFGQPVQRSKSWNPLWAPSELDRGYNVDPLFVIVFYLELTPLSQITEEDAIEVVKIRSSVYLDIKVTYPLALYGFGFDFRYKSSARRRRDFVYFARLTYQEADYLRSRGYYVGDGTEVEYGWVHLKEEIL